MKNKTTLLKGTLWNSLGSIMYSGSSFLMLMLVSRVSALEDIGAFGIAFTTAQILYVIGQFGISHYQMTDYQEAYSFNEYLLARCISCVVMILSGIIICFGLDFKGKKLLYTGCLTVLMLLNVIGDLYQSLFFQKDRLDLSGSALFYRTFWPLCAFCAVLLFQNDIFLAILAQIVVNFGVTLYYIKVVGARFVHKVNIRVHDKRIFHLLQECTPLFFSMLLMSVISNTSKYGVEFLLDDISQGYYNMIFMPAAVINLCSQFFFKPFLKQYSLLLSENKYGEFRRLIIRQCAVIALFSVTCIFATYKIGVFALSVVYAKDLNAFRLPLTLIVIGGSIYALCQLSYYILVILRKQKIILYIYMIGTIVAVITTLGLVGEYFLTGAALSFILAHISILIGYIVMISRYTRST